MDATQTSECDNSQSTSEKNVVSAETNKIQQNCNDEKNKTMSKRAQKRLARCQKHKELQKQRKAENQKISHKKDDAGYSIDDLGQSSYFFENGLRKVYPYSFTFATHAKGRWVGRTIKDVLEKEFGFDHPDDLLKAFDAGHILVNNNRVGPHCKIRDCDFISHRLHRHENPVSWAPLQVIKDTEDLIVINKPSSIPCHPCGRYRFNSIVFILGKEMGYTNLRNIYRLDRLTSGVLILAKTVEMTKTLEDQVVNRQVQKEYVCRVVGKFPEKPIKVDQPLRPLSNKLRLQVVCPTGKASQTEFELLSYNGKSSVVKCRPFTGRTHQIRVHLQYLGHPIINDSFYNNPAWGPSKGKGGSYEVPFEQVCDTILKEHHANLWDGGENPLYFEKVRQMEERPREAPLEKPEENLSNLQAPVSENSSATGNTSVEDATRHRGQQSSKGAYALSVETLSEAPALEEEPLNKIRKLEKNKVVETESLSLQLGNPSLTVGSEISVLQQPFLLIDDTNGSDNNHQSAESASRCDQKVTVDIDRSSMSCINHHKSTNALAFSNPHVPISESLSSHQAKIAMPVDNSDGQTEKPTVGTDDSIQLNGMVNSCPDLRPGFDMSKWSVDTQCDLCKRLPVEPRERDLVMFLHALKYKGPGWEYETDLPDWARADWQREEDYADMETLDLR
ncbi:pseudouridine synthase [Plakobranchus ocellatus]|uniref:Pseudouridine synthase n=1 Tax=Plakobranchus ocellatus TaxID=259542 RepID=A0AAV4C3F9_9GAST|nr:pseudouridine synthase [Plakobranchus ocellatus]